MVVTRQKLELDGVRHCLVPLPVLPMRWPKSTRHGGKARIHFRWPFYPSGTRTGFQLLHGTKVPSMSDWQTQMAGLVQTAPEDRTNPFNLGVSALLTPFRHFLQNALVILSSFDAFRMEAFKLITAYRSEEHTSELQSLMRISYAVFCLKKKIKI